MKAIMATKKHKKHKIDFLLCLLCFFVANSFWEFQ